MTADYFLKKRITRYFTTWIAVVFTLSIMGYAWILSRAERVILRKNFYYVVSKSTHVEASTHEIMLDGGAGYLLETNDQEYVALAVYLKEDDGVAVSSAFANVDKPNVLLLTLKVDALYLKTRKQKENKATYVGAFSSLYGCIEVLEQEIRRMDEGATQRSSKRVLDILGRQLEYMAGRYEKSFTAFANVCKRAVQNLSEILSATVFVKDLRWVLCELCASYTRLAADFSL